MKVKRNVYITNPERLDPANIEGTARYGLSEGDWMDGDWMRIGEVEFEVNVNRDGIVAAVLKNIDSEIIEFKGKIQHLEDKKAELLALPAPVDPEYRGNDYGDDESPDDIAHDENHAIDSQESHTI